MLRKTSMVIFMLMAFASVLSASILPVINYSFDMDTGRSLVKYDILNIDDDLNLSEITIWFDVDLYSNLRIESDLSPTMEGLDHVLVEPDRLLGLDGFYDLMFRSDEIQVGSVKNILISFDWHGVDLPGEQVFDLVDSESFEVKGSGVTVAVPEPVTLSFLAIGVGIVYLKRNNNQ